MPPRRGMAMAALRPVLDVVAMMGAGLLFAVMKRPCLNRRCEGDDGDRTQNQCGETQRQTERNTWKHNPSWFGTPDPHPSHPSGTVSAA